MPLVCMNLEEGEITFETCEQICVKEIHHYQNKNANTRISICNKPIDDTIWNRMYLILRLFRVHHGGQRNTSMQDIRQ